jgi:glycolate oxidase iron-sulfur subunit
MYPMQRLASTLKDLEKQLELCMRCGMCQAYCPVYAETGRESDVARGKLALLDGLIGELFVDPQGVNERLQRCLLCGSCAASCPSGVNALEIFFRARTMISDYQGLSPLKKVLFRKLLAHPELFNRLLEWGARLQGLVLKASDEVHGTACPRFLSPLTSRHLKPLAPVPFHRGLGSLHARSGASGLKVALFPGCLIDKVFPQIGHSMLKSLQHHEVGVFIPDQPGCCGIPALAAGDGRTFNELISYSLRQYATQSFDYLITGCATCAATLKKVWPIAAWGLSMREQQQMLALAGKTLDISQFLVEKLGVVQKSVPDASEGIGLTYHDPCHLKKSLGVAGQPRVLLRNNSDYRLREMAEADRCCGCGGSFNLEHYELSLAIGKRKREAIVHTGCAVVATGCPACMLHLSDVLAQAGDRIQVKHFIEVYAESLSCIG